MGDLLKFHKVPFQKIEPEETLLGLKKYSSQAADYLTGFGIKIVY